MLMMQILKVQSLQIHIKLIINDFRDYLFIYLLTYFWIFNLDIDEEDSILQNLQKNIKPERVIKVDKGVLAGANYMWKHKPRIVLNKNQAKKTKK
jgi:hypothetical protein